MPTTTTKTETTNSYQQIIDDYDEDGKQKKDFSSLISTILNS